MVVCEDLDGVLISVYSNKNTHFVISLYMTSLLTLIGLPGQFLSSEIPYFLVEMAL